MSEVRDDDVAEVQVADKVFLEVLLVRIALKVAQCNPMAGEKYGGCGVEDRDPTIRALNLMNKGYVVLGDPYGWVRGADIPPLATLCCEVKGGAEDCTPPFDYYQTWPVFTGVEMWWEWVNPGVAVVWAGTSKMETVARMLALYLGQEDR